MQFRQLYFLLFCLNIFILAGCEESVQPQGDLPAPEVTVSNPLLAQLTDWDDFVGQFEAVEKVEIRPRVSGYLTQVGFRDGDTVEAGDLLFRIDSRPFEAELQAAQSRLEGAETRLKNARQELARAENLVSIQAISQEEYEALTTTADNAASDVAAASADAEAARLDVEFTSIRAPISGRVSYRRLDIGNAVIADNTVLTTLVTESPIHFIFHASETQYVRIVSQMNRTSDSAVPVRIRLENEGEYRWTGELNFIDNALSAASGTIRGRALLQNDDGFLLPGMYGQMQLQTSGKYEGLLLPDSAIGTLGAKRIVYLVDADNKVASSVVTLGPLNNGLRVIRDGINADDRVVINGLQRVQPGISVQTVAGEISMAEESAEIALTD